MPERLKSLVRARGRGLSAGRRHDVLTRGFEEALLREAEVLSEGGCRVSDGREVYYGSTMITCDLSRLRTHWRELQRKEDTARVELALSRSVRLHVRAMRLARAEVLRRVDNRPLGTVEVETRVRLASGVIHIDIDLEVPLSVSCDTGKR